MFVFFAGLARTVLCPDAEIPYENRPAEKIIELSPESFADRSFQDSVENTLSDQVNAAIKMKKLYNIIDTAFALPLVDALQSAELGYIGYRDINFFDGSLIVKPIPLSSKAASLEMTSQNLNNYIAASPNVDFYVYYIETDKDINFETNEKSGMFEHFTSKLNLPADNIGRLSIDSFDDYRKYFLATDHHWNGIGAYKGYSDICSMLKTEELTASGIHTVYGRYLGTRAAGVEGVVPEDFSVNIFLFPPMNITINGNPAADYGLQSEFIADSLSSFSYGTVFGPDCKEIIFDTGKEGDKLLIMGDSYDNAIIKALAAGFSKTYCIDLRAYNAHSFDLTDYIESHQINRVLLVGGIDYFSSTLY